MGSLLRCVLIIVSGVGFVSESLIVFLTQVIIFCNMEKLTLLLVENIGSRKTRCAQTVAPYLCFHLSSLFFQIVA